MHKSQSLFYLTTALHFFGRHYHPYSGADKINSVTYESSWNYILESLDIITYIFYI